MKSAYELAMERLEKQAPSRKLSDAQKTELAEIDAQYQAKIAEKEVFIRGLIEKATAQGNVGEIQELETQLATEIRRLRADGEEKKQKVRERPADS